MMQAETPGKPPPKTYPVWRAALIAAAAVFVFFGCLQLIPVSHTNPPVVQEPKWDSQETRALAQRACFDCHSNETVWPWYSNVAPVSWLVTFDVARGRREMNFSEWSGGGSQFGGRGSRTAKRIEEAINGREMPPANYLMLHPEARLSEAERQQLIDGMMASLSQ